MKSVRTATFVSGLGLVGLGVYRLAHYRESLRAGHMAGRGGLIGPILVGIICIVGAGIGFGDKPEQIREDHL